MSREQGEFRELLSVTSGLPGYQNHRDHRAPERQPVVMARREGTTGTAREPDSPGRPPANGNLNLPVEGPVGLSLTR